MKGKDMKLMFFFALKLEKHENQKKFLFPHLFVFKLESFVGKFEKKGSFDVQIGTIQMGLVLNSLSQADPGMVSGCGLQTRRP